MSTNNAISILQHTIENIYNNETLRVGRIYKELTSSESDAFTTGLKIPLKEKMEIPLFLEYLYGRPLFPRIEDFFYNEALFYLACYWEYERPIQTASVAIKKVFNSRYNHSLIKMTIKNTVYYMGKGVILNKDKKLLFLLTDTYNDNQCRQVTGYKAYVDFSVFENLSDSVCKYISSNIIPALGATTFFNFYNDIEHEMRIPIIIQDLSGFTTTTVSPNPKIDMNQALKKVLVDNIDEIRKNLL